MDGIEFTLTVETVHGDGLYTSEMKPLTRKELARELRRIANQIERRAYPGWDQLEIKLHWRYADNV